MQAVKKTFDVLELIAMSKEGVSLDSLSKSLGYPKATAHRICKTLIECGYLRQLSSGHYCISAKLLSLGYGVVQHDPLATEVTPILQALADEMGFNVNLQRRDLHTVILLKKEEPKHAIFHTNARPGLVSPLHQAACGKIILAHLDPSQWREYWQLDADNPDRFRHFSDRNIGNMDDFFQENQRIKQQGWAIDGEGNESGITCVAVPLLTDNIVQYAISVSGLTPEIHRYGMENIIERLNQLSAGIINKHD